MSPIEPYRPSAAAIASVLLLSALAGPARGQTEGLRLDADAPVHEAPADAALDLTEEVTLEAWIKADPLPPDGGRIIDKMPPGSTEGYLLDTWPGNSLRLITSGGQCRFEARLGNGRWTHVAGVYSAPRKVMKLYVDGLEVASCGEGRFPAILVTAAPLRIGADQDGRNRFSGSLRRAAVYRRALDPGEISRRAADPEAPAPAGVVADWSFEGPLADVVRPVAGTVPLLRPETFSGEAPPPGLPLALWYRQPASRWTEASVIGNGRLGGMVRGGVRRERIDLNEDTLWSGEPYDNLNPKGLAALPEIRRLLLEGKNGEAQRLVEECMQGRYNQCYMPLGTIRLDSPAGGPVTGYRRVLDLETAIVRVEYEQDGTRFRREVFASSPAGAIVVRIGSDGPGKVSFTASLESQLRHALRAVPGALVLSGRSPVHADPHFLGRRVEYDDAPDGKGMRFEARLAARADGGSLGITDRGIVAEGCEAVTLVLVAATSYAGPHRSPSREGRDPAGACEAALAALAGSSFEALRTAHVADHRRLFDRVRLDLGSTAAADRPTDIRLKEYVPGSDPSLAALYYQFGRYLLIASSRPGTQPSHLQGIWSRELNPAWSANWTLNCNAQIDYWPVETANLAECHEPLIDLTRELSVDGAHIAKGLYGARGWVAHHNTDIWRQAGPVSGSACWSLFQVGGAWLCQHLWEHYAFGGDREYLRRVWPVLAGAARFYLDALIEEPSGGFLVTAPDVNFENAFRKPDGTSACTCMGPTASMQMVRELFRNCLAGGAILDVDGDLRKEIEEALPKLPPMEISPTSGELQEWLDDWARTAECQVLSSWGAICSGQITPRGTPELAAGLRKIFDSGGWWKGGAVGSWQGAFQANAYARLGDGDTALAVVDMHLRRAVNPNLSANFSGMAEWEIDGNLGITAAIGEMLLQSQTGELELLPALPRAWASGRVRGLRARGGFEVDIEWQEGKLAGAAIRSSAGGTCRVRLGERTREVRLGPGEEARLDGELRRSGRQDP